MPNYKKFNIGEWSESYVFLRLLSSNGTLNIADNNLNSIPNQFFTIKAIIKPEVIYEINSQDPEIHIQEKDKPSFSVNKNQFLYYSNFLLDKLLSKKGNFEVPAVEDFLKSVKLDSLKAKSKLKSDIDIKIHDPFTNTEPTIGFSIKSYLGSRPTLLNASQQTIINYRPSKELTNNLTPTELDALNAKGTILDKINRLKSKNINLTFNNLNSNTFEFNLKMIDTEMPSILADLFYCSYFVRGKRISKVVDYYCDNFHKNHDLIEYKVKELLISIALGMVPNTKWDGLDQANGGYIVVKQNGEIVGYNIYERNKLKGYLYNSTNFDTPSLSRYNCGNINERGAMSLGCMIRFWQ